MDFRHEWKHEIDYSDMLALRSRLSAVMRLDEHASGGSYQVRSLYFDNLADKALWEKLDGVDVREKFRLRCYNRDAGLILLEKKSKVHGLCHKEQARLTLAETRAILAADSLRLMEAEQPLVQELARKMQAEGLRPRTIVDCTREPFVYAPGNVRVTLDYDLRTGLDGTAFLEPHCVTVPVEGNPVILEVKWDAFLPALIRDIVQLPGRHTGAFSKYAACRMYG